MLPDFLKSFRRCNCADGATVTNTVWSAVAAIAKGKGRSCSSRRRKKQQQQQGSSNDDDTRDLGYAATRKAKGRIRVRVSPFVVVFFRPQTKLVLWVLSEGSQAKSDVACSYRLCCGRSS